MTCLFYSNRGVGGGHSAGVGGAPQPHSVAKKLLPNAPPNPAGMAPLSTTKENRTSKKRGAGVDRFIPTREYNLFAPVCRP